MRVGMHRYRDGGLERASDRVAAEEPLEIRLAFRAKDGPVLRPVAVTMRTPGDDVELAVGFLFSEGVVTAKESVREVAHCPGGGPQEFNVVEVRLAPGTAVPEGLMERNFYVSSSCGVCGKASLDAVTARGVPTVQDSDFRLHPEMVARLPARLRRAQAVFQRTGGLHAAGLFDEEGETVAVREDVGRHNAVDKVVGRSFLAGELPLARRTLVVSGRTSFEIVVKAAAAGVPLVVAVGAPSSLAVAVARRFDVTLVGFARDGGFNVYTGGGRIG